MTFDLDAHISKTPDFPKDGITFYDFSPALEDGTILRQMIDALCKIATPLAPDVVAGIDARGFLFATPLALSMGCGAVMIRKAGKLPGKVIEKSYALEYGEARLSVQTSRDLKGKRILLVDDLLATGGTLSASVDLIEQAGGIIAGTACLIELTGLGGRALLAEKNCPVVSLQSYEF
ncbi:MAG: adenine phosphoribosyltransferase [Candidatus Puniceispirillaceae bacterium]